MALNSLSNKMSLTVDMGYAGTRQLTRTVSVNNIRNSFADYEVFCGHVAAVLANNVLAAKVTKSFLIV